MIAALNGTSGLLAGIRDVLVPHMQAKYQAQLDEQKRKNILADSQLPAEQVEAITGLKFGLPPGTRIDKSLIPFLTAQQKTQTSSIENPVTETQARDLAAQGKPLPPNAKIVPDAKPEPLSPEERQLQIQRAKLKGSLPQAKSALKGAKDSLNDQIATIDSILKDPALPYVTGVVASKVGGMAGPGRSLAAKIDQLRAKGTLSALLELRSQGGTLGQVSNTEDQMLANSRARFDRGQPTTDFKTALSEYKGQLQRSLGNLDSAFNDTYGDLISMPSISKTTETPARVNARVKVGTNSASAPSPAGSPSIPTVTSQSEYDKLASGSVYLDASGTQRRKK